MASSPRANKTLTTHELARFLALLAETGNFALACDQLGRAKSGLYKRRIRDSLFDSECVAAIALFRSSLERGGGPLAAEPMVEGAQRRAALKTLTLTTYAGLPQLRRALPGSLTRTGLETFLKTLAATGNVRFAAASVSVAASSIYYRIRTDPAFAAEIAVAKDTARAALEMTLIEATGAFGDGFLNPPRNGEGNWHAQGVRGTAEHDDAEHSGAHLEGGGGAGADDVSAFTTRMTVSEAIRLVGRLERSLARDAERSLPRMSDEQVRDELVRRLAAFGRRLLSDRNSD